MKQIRFALMIFLIAFGVSILLTDCTNDDPEGYKYVEWVAEDLGSPGEGWGTPTGLALDPSDNKPVVVFIDMSTTGGHRPHVMKWSNDTTWTDLGFLTASLGDHPSLAIDPSDNKPIVAFVDNVNGAKTHVMKWSSGTTWTNLGFLATDLTKGPVVVIDPSDNKPIVAYVNDNDRAHVMKWDTLTTWNDLGFPSTGSVLPASVIGGTLPPQLSIAIDPSDNKPIVIFIDNNNGDRAHVMKWESGTTWIDMGFLSTSAAFYVTAIAFDPLDNKPVAGVVESSDVVEEKLHILKWSSGTSWIDMGYPVLNEESAGSFSLVIDPSDNKPVAARVGVPIKGEIGAFINITKWSSGTSWTYLGSLRTREYSGTNSMVIDPSDNKLVVMYEDEEFEKLRVKKGGL